MVNRKRYYNSFFDQINDYKQRKPVASDVNNYIHHHVLGAGLLGALFLSVLSVGALNLFVLRSTGQSTVAYIKTETRPAFQIFNQLQNADSSFASELDGTRVWSIADAYTSMVTPQSSFGKDEVVMSGGKGQSRAFLRFDLSSLTHKDDLVLKLHPANSFRGSIQVTMLPVDELWEEDLLTAESAPVSRGQVIGRSEGTFAMGQSVDFDLKDSLVDQNMVSLVVSASGSADGFAFYAHEHGQSAELVAIH